MPTTPKIRKFASFISAAALSLTAGAALAGNTLAPIVEAEPVAVDTGTGWTGFYAGVHAGPGWSDDSYHGGSIVAFGVQAGFLFDMGSIVLGAEAAYSMHTLDIWVTDQDTFDGKFRVGYDAGRFLPYATAGASYYRVNGDGSMMALVGAGVDFAVSDHVRIGGEYLHQWNDTYSHHGSPTFAFKADTVTLRLNYGF
jgi:outer membrane immunogenic protein